MRRTKFLCSQRGRESGKVLQDLEQFVRQFRKHRTSLVVGTQSLKDFYANASAQTVFEQSAFSAILSQKEATLDSLRKEGKIATDEEKELLAKVYTRKGVYSEVLLCLGSGGKVLVQIRLCDLAKKLFFTESEHRAAIACLKKEGATLLEALDLAWQHKENLKSLQGEELLTFLRKKFLMQKALSKEKNKKKEMANV